MNEFLISSLQVHTLIFIRASLNLFPIPKMVFVASSLVYCLFVNIFCSGNAYFLALKSAKRQHFLHQFHQFFLDPIKIYRMALPFMLLFWALDKISPTTHNLVHDWLNLLNSFLLVLSSYILGQNLEFLAMLETNRKAYLWASILFGACMYIFVHYPIIPVKNDNLAFLWKEL